jgi:NAD(P)-dependent dehydrogenase (short-subunit alcohol dehydrogenase family)
MSTDGSASVALVTGAARAIGRAIARRLAADRMRVIVTDIEARRSGP